MAETVAARLLTEAHRRSQLRIRAATIREFLTIWPMFTLADIDGSWPAVEAALLALVAARRRESAETAANYYRAFRAAERIPGTATPILAPAPDPVLTVATFRLLGPIQTKKNLTAGAPNPLDRAFTLLSGSLTRQVLNAGRETLAETVKADPAATGYRRVTSGSACDFCAGIAARGVVGVDVDFAAHDHCSCTQEPAYRR